METIKEIFQSIYDSYRERIKSPFVGSFLLSYLLFNWRAVAILFYADWPVHCRIEWIEENYCNWYNYVVPLLIALFYIMGLPYVNMLFDKVLNYYSESKLEKKNSAKLAKYDQKELEAIAEKKVIDAKAGTSLIKDLTSKNDALLKEIEEINARNTKEINRLVTKEHDLNEKLDDLRVTYDILNEKYKKTNSIDKETILLDQLSAINAVLTKFDKESFLGLCESNAFGPPKSKANSDQLNKFVGLGLIIISVQDKITITEKGRYFYDYLAKYN